MKPWKQKLSCLSHSALKFSLISSLLLFFLSLLFSSGFIATEKCCNKVPVFHRRTSVRRKEPRLVNNTGLQDVSIFSRESLGIFIRCINSRPGQSHRKWPTLRHPWSHLALKYTSMLVLHQHLRSDLMYSKTVSHWILFIYINKQTNIRKTLHH